MINFDDRKQNPKKCEIANNYVDSKCNSNKNLNEKNDDEFLFDESEIKYVKSEKNDMSEKRNNKNIKRVNDQGDDIHIDDKFKYHLDDDMSIKNKSFFGKSINDIISNNKEENIKSTNRKSRFEENNNFNESVNGNDKIINKKNNSNNNDLLIISGNKTELSSKSIKSIELININKLKEQNINNARFKIKEKNYS